MSIEAVQQALIQRLVAGMPMLTANQFAWENKDFASQPGQIWLQVFFMPVTERIGTMGPGGLDQSDGLFQINVLCPTGNGELTLRKTINDLRSCFIPGNLLYKDQPVTILSRSRAGGKIVSGFYRVPFTVRWRAQIPRTD
jgi:hypothetical protein